MTDDFKYDVFISYTSANKDWVRKTFVPALENAGLRCCDYYRDFEVGAPIVKEMERAVLESHKTILVLSPAYLKSGWTEFENLMLQTLDAANQEHRLLPVIYEKCDLPLRFRYMNCANFDHPDDVEIEWQRLFKALGSTGEAPRQIHDSSNWHLAHPYPMPPNFTGRAAEQKILDDWLANNKDRLLILRALGGFGKSSLSWQWINNHVNPGEWPKLVWWSFYEGDASFEHFIEETLKYLKLDVPQGKRDQVDALLNGMRSQKVLLIIDGFERVLRAYSSMSAAYQGDEEPKLDDTQLDCVDVNAELFLKGICSLPNIKGKVLMTTRLTPRAVKPRGEFMLGCCEFELTAMQKADAVEFFHKQGIKGNRGEIESACETYGYHPLSLRLLAGRILKDFETPADIVVAQKLKIDGDIIQQKHHVLEVSYNSLPQHEQKLLSTIACFRSPVELKTIETIANDVGADRDPPLRDSLHDLVDRGLLHFDDKKKKFDLHPIVRRFSYDRLTASDRTAAHTRLVNYFDAVPKSENVKTLEDLAPVIELYHHTVCARHYDEAAKLLLDRIAKPLFYGFGAYRTYIELLQVLFPNAEHHPSLLQDEHAQAWILNQLANSFGRNGQPRNAILAYERGITINEKLGNIYNVQIGLGGVVMVAYKPLGMLKQTEKNLQRLIELADINKDRFNEARGHLEWGILFAYESNFVAATEQLDLAHRLFENLGARQCIGLVWAHRAISFFLAGDNWAMLKAAQKARKFADSEHYEQDIIQSEWLLGKAFLMGGKKNLAATHLNEALTRDRAINLVEMEANILLDLAHLRYNQTHYEEAKSLAEAALTITERSGYVLQGADVNLFLAQYALEQDKDKVKAKAYAESALKLAYCDGPPYCYKVAYEEAERMIVRLNDEG